MYGAGGRESGQRRWAQVVGDLSFRPSYRILRINMLTPMYSLVPVIDEKNPSSLLPCTT